MTSPAIPSPKGEMLKPCPFCNGPASLVALAGNQVRVLCVGDDCEIESVSVRDTKAEAIAAWNRRSSSSREEVRREALERAFAEIEALNLGRRDTILRLRAALSQGE